MTPIDGAALPYGKPVARIVNPAVLPLDDSLVELLNSPNEAYGACPLCGTVGRLNRAHVVPKGQRGDDAPENVAWLCGDGVMGCHGILTHGNRVIGHPLDPVAVVGEWIRYCRVTVPELGAYSDRKKFSGWLETFYRGLVAARRMAG